ncbi:hypothetical protein [Pteropox virus]|uniref:Uncharacterized protein n=1 Tax=Pteropox virus TaxID=1873698 RepID=A0A1B1MRA2_9POXV|nr:hypothetical protein [Pteropox virus]ANS71108.1 hypothetical protein [Pteropox virus]
MEVSTLEDIIALKPFYSMSKTKRNEEQNCIMGNRCFVKVSSVRHIPSRSIDATAPIFLRNQKFYLEDLLFSPFHFSRMQYQYLSPGFVMKCINRAKPKKTVFCVTEKTLNDNKLSIDVFVPTTDPTKYLIIGLRVVDFWKSKFEII